MHSLPHGINSALQRFQPLSVHFGPWRELQSTVCERCCEPVLPDVDAFWRGAEGWAPV